MLSSYKLLKEPVFWVTFSVSLAITPHLVRFPAWAIALIISLIIWRLLCISRPNLAPAKWVLILITFASCLGIYIHFGTLIGRTAGSIILSILLIIKLHESKSQRDFMLVIGLTFFVIVTNFLFSQSIFTVTFMLSIIIILLISMQSINQGNGFLSLKRKLMQSIKLLLHALPLMLIMFFLFPRIPGPLWQLPEDKTTSVTGLSDTMSPGNISNLIKSNAVAFRATFKQDIPHQSQLYWRTIVLWYFDGTTWEPGKLNRTPWRSISTDGPTIDYTITMEPHQNRWLYALDMPVKSSENIVNTKNFILIAIQNINSRYQYSASSVLNYKIQTDLSRWEEVAGLKIPANTNIKTINYGKSLAEKYSNKTDIVKHVLRKFREEAYHYTLKPPLTPGFNPVDQFLFETRRGFCEHYASSFTLLMRAAGIPSRIIMGYQGGTINPLNNILTVRQSDAHAWSEVWLKDRGWVRIDPTAAIAPERIEQSLDAALDENEVRPFHMTINKGLVKELFFLWDAFDNQWNEWVIGYDNKLQKELLSSLLNKEIRFTDVITLMIAAFLIGLIFISLFILAPWKKAKELPETQAYRKFCNKLSRRGIKKQPYEGPVDFSNRAVDHLPQHKDSIELITRLYTRIRYQANHTNKQVEQLQQLVRQFRPERNS